MNGGTKKIGKRIYNDMLIYSNYTQAMQCKITA
jgi:hypothetical protein